MARAAQGKVPASNHGFVTYEDQRESKIEGEFEAFGIGYDEKRLEPGAFYEFGGTNGREIKLENEEPDPEGSFQGQFPPDDDD